jgi:GNAT superfamily N-acetyltransferase
VRDDVGVDVDVVVRRGGVGDAVAAAEVWLRSRRACAEAGTIPAPVHADDDVRRWFAEEVVVKRELWVAVASGVVCGVLVLDGSSVDQLYVDPALTGRGAGSRLLEVARRERPSGLSLWTFQSNTGARRFYARQSFVEVRRTDGAANEERAPDVLLRWPGVSGR